jgi:(2Fe-2S) ferredoxin
MSIFKKHVFVCTGGKTCPTQGSEEVFAKLKEEATNAGLKREVRINKSGCMGQCGKGPIVVVYPDAVWYGGVQVDDASEIVRCHLVDDQPVERLRYPKVVEQSV